ncbi:hypothetical protein UPYG_G00046950 [Umbra pygmaea]|uniref:C-type lectin domain-containing protein n=1 Tax=Umbra pygmaea TaxID=75934 RepID=A0ABD0XTC4_UMBPY
MTALFIFALLCVGFSVRTAAVPMESKDVPVEVSNSVQEVRVAVEDPEPKKLSNTSARLSCPDGWFSFQSKCFLFVRTPMSWFDAENYCNEFGASLASSGSSPEYRYLQQMTRTAGKESAWIGGFYLQSYWLWIDRSGMYYTNWYSQSTPASNPCMYLQSAVGQGWRNSGCGSSLSSICVHLNRC